MTREIKVNIGLFFLLVVSIIYFNINTTKKINWSESYIKDQKIPFGTYVLYHELPSLFPTSEIESVNSSVYSYLNSNKLNGLYLFIDKDINFGKEELEKLMGFVYEGNNVFISTHNINIDTFRIKSKRLLSENLNDSSFFELVNENLDLTKYYFDRNFPHYVFNEIDTINTIVLGKSGIENSNDEIVKEGINFISYKYGKGLFYFHSFPEAFTNYFILKSSNENYVSAMLSYPQNTKTIFWDSYYKTGKIKFQSPLYYIFSNDSLKWAYYTLLTGIFLFFIFKAKRKQRSIPILIPLQNKTLGFTQTIANLYFEKSEHKKIAEHKINYFLDYIRIRFRLETTNIDKSFKENLAEKSNNKLEEVDKLFNIFKILQKKEIVTKEELIDLEILIDKFKH